jgi:thimet oligopeptidase
MRVPNKVRLLIFTFATIACHLPAGSVVAQDAINAQYYLWVTPARTATRVQYRTFPSTAVGSAVSYHIYVPEIYESATTQRFPVVYWLHGAGGGGPGLPLLAARLDSAIRAGTIPPMLVVFPNGLALGMYVDWKSGRVPMETVLIKELVPHIDTNFRTIPTRQGRLLEGFSMGGYGAARLAFKYSHMFAAASLLAPGPVQEELTAASSARTTPAQTQMVLDTIYGSDQEYFKAQSPWRLAEQNVDAVRLLRIRQVIGDSDNTLQSNRQFHDRLTRLQIPHDFIVLPGVSHNSREVFEALGPRHLEFFRDAFAAVAGTRSEGAHGLHPARSMPDEQSVPPSAQETNSATADGRPFYSGITDEASLTRRVEGHLTRANALLERLLAISGQRTPENTLRVYDDLMAEVLNARGPVQIVGQLHPDARMRATAAVLLQRIDSSESRISLHRGVFDALAAIDSTGSPPEVRHYLRRELAQFRRQGIDRDRATRDRLQRLWEELFAAEQEFGRNIQEGVRRIQLESVAELDGLPADYIAAHPPDASGRITLTTAAPDAGPVMSFARSKELRRRMHLETGNVAFPANVAVLKRMLGLRHQIARTLGYPNWASYDFEGQMADSPAHVAAFLDRVVAASAPTIARGWEELLARKRLDDPGAQVVESWEAPFYANLVRQATYDFDALELRPYLAYDRVRDGLLQVTSNLFGFHYARVTDVPVWHPSVEVYDVSEEGRRVGRIYLDTHPRPGKAGSGASAAGVRRGVRGVQLPEIVLIARFPGGQPGDPGLLMPGEVTLFFHEFGHVVHALAASGRDWIVPRLERDFEEVPSQLFEEWSTDPSVLATFARHYQTDEPVPATLLQRMRRAGEFSRGAAVRTDALYARFSLSLHDRDPAGVEPNEVYREIANAYLPNPYTDSVYAPAGLRSLRGRGASRYTYLWGETITKDLFSRFDGANLLDPIMGRKYRETVLAPGGSKPAAELVQAFLGRPFNVAAWERWLNGQTRQH